VITVYERLLCRFHFKVVVACFEGVVFFYGLFFNGEFVLNLVFAIRGRAQTQRLFVWFSFDVLAATPVLFTKWSAEFIGCLARIKM